MYKIEWQVFDGFVDLANASVSAPEPSYEYVKQDDFSCFEWFFFCHFDYKLFPIIVSPCRGVFCFVGDDNKMRVLVCRLLKQVRHEDGTLDFI